MKKLILASTAALAMFGLAACSDTDDTTTQSIDEPAATAPAEEGTAMEPNAAEEPAQTESVAPEAPEANQ